MSDSFEKTGKDNTAKDGKSQAVKPHKESSERAFHHGSGRRRPRRDDPPPPAVSHALRQVVLQPLERARYVIFDIESTGGNPERNGITEIFALQFSNGKIGKTFYSMVNPLVPVPPIVRRMTGITNAMVRNAPKVEDVMPKFVEFIGNDILVSHNTIGDMKFLRHFSEQVCGEAIPNFFMCTHLLVEKIAHESPDKSLKGLAKHFNLPSGNLHRAEADAVLTLELFKLLLERLASRSIKSPEAAIRLQGDLESAARLGWGIKPSMLKEIPDAPGIFSLFDHDQRLLFASSASSLSRDVAKLERHGQVPRQMLRLVLRSYDLKWEVFPNLFEAMLKETEIVANASKATKLTFPPSDWHQRFQNVFYVIDTPEGARVDVGEIPPGAQYAFGPINDRKAAHLFLAHIGDVLGLKVGRHGVTLPKELIAGGCEIWAKFFENSSKMDSELGRIQRGLVALKIFFRKAEGERMARQLALLKSLDSIVDRPKVESLLDESGVVLVFGKKTGAWHAYSIEHSLPKFRAVIEVKQESSLTSFSQQLGDLKARLQDSSFLKMIFRKAKIPKKSKSKQKSKSIPLTVEEAAKINATLWWINTQSGRRDGVFLQKK